MSDRAICAVPFCGFIVPDSSADDEGLCAQCWRKCSGPVRRRYEAAWNEATAAEKSGPIDLDTAERVTTSWEELKAHALRVCTGRA